MTVTATDTPAGERRACSGCPVWRALTEALPGRSVRVWPDRVVIDGRPYYQSQAFWDWVAAYDLGATDLGPVAVELPDELFAEVAA